ncbi:alpha/beta fold hydrolase [Planococcus halotolerans]|uniref:alpha/beta fold hydrolase n=1 Tax=Planococcus halotolerans TaxID=2233542 RepID=UPI001092C3CE|nr:alpha/beta hydrolase [Planococcus halotolerans]QHJ70128.1 alpha/beta fold hydrolase [Planococcus halotolerans]
MVNGKYIEVDPGVELFVQDVGNGDPLVLIPGWVFSAEAFASQIAYFSKTYRVIAIDPRSQGRSTKSLQGNDYITHGKDVTKVIEELGLKDVTLLGWSFGCLTAWEYIRQNGTDNVKAAVIVDLSPKPLSRDDENDWVEGPLEEIAGAYTSNLRNPEGQRAFITEYATEIMVQRELTEDELQWIIEEALTTPYYIASNLFAAGMFSDYREEAKILIEKVPTLTIAAEHWGDTARSFMQRISPEARVEILGGHLMFWEHSEKFNEILEHFLKSDA